MKTGRLILAISLMMVMTAGIAAAKEKTSVELGQKLFNDPKLGGATSGQTCNSCHAGGKGLEKAGNNTKLAEMINKCITGALQGKKIDGRSVEMKSLKLYIQSIAK